MGLLKKYWGTLRRMRLLHILYNIRHYGQLKRNKKLYQKFGAHKSVVASITHHDFKQHSTERPWLDMPGGLAEVQKDIRFSALPPEMQQQLSQWPDTGFMILNGFVNPDTCDQISGELQTLIDHKTVDFDYTNSRVMNAWQHCAPIRQVINDKKLLDFLSFTLNRETLPFQTINFLKGSRQKTHSDFIHMTTEPEGYLIAIWVALEDISPDSGPLHYYPGSHKLPYLLGEHFEHNSNSLFVGDDLYGNYEKQIAALVAEKKLDKKVFTPRKGDLLIWHANLLHGGEPVTNEKQSRKSLVVHYFCKGDIVCYHEISQRPAILPKI